MFRAREETWGRSQVALVAWHGELGAEQGAASTRVKPQWAGAGKPHTACVESRDLARH